MIKWYFTILNLISLEIEGSDTIWASTAEEAQQKANALCGKRGKLAGEVEPLNF